MSSTPARVLTALALAATVAVGAWSASAAAETSSETTFGPGPFCCIG